MTRYAVILCGLATLTLAGCAGGSAMPTSPSTSTQTATASVQPTTPSPSLALPADGSYTYTLALHLISGSDCYLNGRAAAQPAPFTDATFMGTAVVSNGELQFGLPGLPFSAQHAASFVLNASGAGTLTGEVRPWEGVGPLLMTFDMNVSALSGTGLSGTLAGEYSDEGFPLNYRCNASQISFTLTPGQ